MNRATKRLAAVGLSAALLALGACADVDKGGGPYQAPGGPDVMNRQGPGDIAIPGENANPRSNEQGATGTGAGTGIPAPTTP